MGWKKPYRRRLEEKSYVERSCFAYYFPQYILYKFSKLKNSWFVFKSKVELFYLHCSILGVLNLF